MPDHPETVELPDLLRRYFWEYDPARLSWEGSRHTIVTRLLQSGGWDAVRWLRAHVSDDELRELLVRRRGRGIDPKRLRFWGLILDLPREQVDEWIAVARSNPWHQRTTG
jgi:hypothetical protein